MKRKEFIRNISLVGVGISLAPIRLFASPSNAQIALPSATTHIPHGNFADANTERIQIPELDIEVSVQHFMRTGIEIDQKDVSVITFWRNQEVLNVCFDKSSCHFSGQIPGLKTAKSKHHFTLANNRFELELNPNSSHLSLRPI